MDRKNTKKPDIINKSIFALLFFLMQPYSNISG